MIPRPSKEAYWLLHEGAKALAAVEAVGMRIDLAYLQRATQAVREQIQQLQQQLRGDAVFELWRRRFGKRFNLGSRTQLATILFDELGYESQAKTEQGRHKVDESQLELIDHVFVQTYLRLEKLKKLDGTYLKGVSREVCEGYLHPSFNLHLVSSYRSSSSNPNFQNIPIRDPEVAKIIRTAFIPRPGHVILEVDFSAIEVRVAACLHRDSTMLEYIRTNHDMHADMAAELYLLEPEQVTKEIRFAAKNSFVFAEFYGDFYPHVAKNLWSAIGRNHLPGPDGKSLYEHLKASGCVRLGVCDPAINPAKNTFERHVQEVERQFWDVQFREYRDWKRQWWEDYLERGWFQTLTGFVVSGIYRRNVVINTPIQGSAFHCLLWSLITMNRWLQKHRFKSVIIGQIHDSIVLDVERTELPAVLEKVQQVMQEELRAAWSWIITPLEVEAEVGERNWFEKHPVS